MTDVRIPDEALGLESGRARIVPYQPAWADLFAREAGRIREALGDRVLSIEHIGSTAIPGMPAKPILDLMAGVSTLEAGYLLVPGIEALGYEHRPDPEIPERIFFRRRVRGLRTHHLSLAEPSSRFYRVQLCFRDYLRANSRIAGDYAALKQSLAEAHTRDRRSYTEGKTEFVLEVLRTVGCG